MRLPRYGHLPSAFVVKIPIGALLKLLSDDLGFLVSLKPGVMLLVEPPALILECLGRQVLLRCSLLVVKDVEQGIWVDTRVQPRVVEYRQRLAGKAKACWWYRHLAISQTVPEEKSARLSRCIVHRHRQTPRARGRLV